MNTRNGLPVLVLAIVLAQTGGAATLTLPEAQAGTEGNYNNVFPFAVSVHGLDTQRYQQVYDAAGFANAGTILITGMNFRPDAMFGSAFRFTLPAVRIDLSTTAARPGLLDTVFAKNTGADDTIVFPTGALTLSSSFTGPPDGPKSFDIEVTFATPFLYDPSKGNLLLDVWNFGGGPDPSGLNAAFDSEQADGDAVSRVFTRADGSVNSPSGITDSAGLVTQFEFVSLPEPATAFIVCVGVAALTLLGYKRAL